MTEKQKGPDIDPATADADQTRGQQPGAQGSGSKAGTREDKEKLRENQRRLHVGPDHKTPEMQKEKRGTFP